MVKPGAKFRLKDWPTDDTGKFKTEEEVADELERHCRKLDALQDVLSAEGRHALLIVLQAMDTGGKDGTIRHIFTGVNPQGVDVTAFKVPTPLEAAHDYLWRVHAAVPRLGTIGIFNRSHYEDVLVTRVHKMITDKTAKRRFREINHFEEMLFHNNVTILKFFLHISHKEQTARLKARCEEKDKHYKISESRLPRAAISGTSTSRRMKTRSARPARNMRRGSSFRRTTSGTAIWRFHASSSRRCRG